MPKVALGTILRGIGPELRKRLPPADAEMPPDVERELECLRRLQDRNLHGAKRETRRRRKHLGRPARRRGKTSS